MNDWKPGDRFTIEFEVRRLFAQDEVRTIDGHTIDASTMARAVKLPPKARPVRKGDELVNNSAPYIFLAYWNDTVVATIPDRMVPLPYDRHSWRHADGSPIDWEASE